MLLPARTVKYIDALNREGDKFDYWKWVRRVQEEESTQAEYVSPLIPSGELNPTGRRQSSRHAGSASWVYAP